FGALVIEQALELHTHGGGVAAAARVFGLEHDPGVAALHDDVAGADFLSDFHNEITSLGWAGSVLGIWRLRRARGSAKATTLTFFIIMPATCRSNGRATPGRGHTVRQ